MTAEASWIEEVARVELARHALILRRQIPSATGGNLPVQHRLFCRLTRVDGTVGYGEAAPHPIHGPRLEEIEESVQAALSSTNERIALPHVLDMALVDAQARAHRDPAWRFLRIPEPPAFCQTVVTFGGTDPEAVCREIATSKPSAIKLKLLGGEADLSVIGAISQAFPVPLAIDVNGAWTPEEAADKLRAIEAIRPDLLWVEQPCQPSQATHRLSTRLRIFADEAVDHPGTDLSIYDGVVLKPTRSGIRRCIELAQRARVAGQQVTMGCNLQSSLMSNVTLMLSGLVTCDWIDLDTVILVDADPFRPPEADLETGRICTPQGYGFATTPSMVLPWQSVYRRAAS